MIRVLIAALALVTGVSTFAGAQCSSSTGCTECNMPSTYTNVAVVTEGDITVTFASDKASYNTGETVQFYLIVKNDGASQWYLNWLIDPQDGIFVMPPTCTSIEPVADCFENAVFVHPGIIYFYSAGTTLDPGKCRVWERQWDTNLFPTAPGMYHVLGGMFEQTLDATVGHFVMPTGGALLNVTIEGAVGAESASWGAVKTVYR